MFNKWAKLIVLRFSMFILCQYAKVTHGELLLPEKPINIMVDKTKKHTDEKKIGQKGETNN